MALCDWIIRLNLKAFNLNIFKVKLCIKSTVLVERCTGETGRCIKARFDEHIKTSGTNITEVGKHLACSPTCTISFENVSILVHEHRMRKRRILESLYISDFNLREILNDNSHSVPLYLFNIPQKR